MNVILFGPPGVGKSTTIGILKTMGIGAIDLEDLYPNRIRFQVPNLVDNKVLGAADLNPKRKYRNAIKVLIYASQDAYDARRDRRDQIHREKMGQPHHMIEDWVTDDFDYLLDTTNLSQTDTADRILNIMKGGSSHVTK